MMARLLFPLCLLWLSTSTAMANPLEELRQTEQRLKTVVRLATPATVSLVADQPNPDNSRPRGGAGSGVIVNKEGLILTAAHVIDGASKVTVVFTDGTQVQGTVLGANYSRDVAMVGLPPGRDYPHVAVGESKSLKIGTPVVALGHSAGYDPTRTPPVRFGRVITHGPGGFITTDCALIGGDSGGPLFNLEGEVIGIHSHIGEKRSVNNHASISGLKRSWQKMERGDVWGALGSVRPGDQRPVIGVYLDQSGSLPHARVDGVAFRGPAFRAGIQAGDWLIAVGDHPVNNARDLQEALFDYEPRETVSVRFYRPETEEVLNSRLRLRSEDAVRKLPLTD